MALQILLKAGVAAIAGAQADTGCEAAAPEASQPLAWSSNIALVSDYRGRGISFSDESAAVQGGVDVVAPSGWSAGVWASTIDEDAEADMEIDLYAAHSFAVGAAEAAFGLGAYVFPGAENWEFAEAQASLAFAAGPFDVAFSVNYAWEQDNLGGEDNLYVALNIATPIGALSGAPISLGGSLGFEEGPFAMQDQKIDWSISATVEIEQVAFSVSYVDTDLQGGAGEPAWVFSIARAF